MLASRVPKACQVDTKNPLKEAVNGYQADSKRQLHFLPTNSNIVMGTLVLQPSTNSVLCCLFACVCALLGGNHRAIPLQLHANDPRQWLHQWRLTQTFALPRQEGPCLSEQ